MFKLIQTLIQKIAPPKPLIITEVCMYCWASHQDLNPSLVTHKFCQVCAGADPVAKTIPLSKDTTQCL